ncbi:MAG TPA: radical SAM protein [Candidatus Bathyarchaeia archaeon]|nr:radical SAM protein [Candidatus Bathyarchaeia archaeon]
MEYYIYVTKDCNYNCKYCDVLPIARQSGSLKNAPNIGETVNYILADKTCADTEKTVVFYGGEPLMNSSFIREFISQTEGRGLKYLLHTNGSLLKEADPLILKHMDYIFISIDGYRDVQDIYRGSVGSFDAIMQNVHEIKSQVKGQIMARITLPISPDVSLFKAVMGVIDTFDYVYCQVENDAFSRPVKLLQQFKSNFSDDLKKLVEYWIVQMRKGIVKNIVPFQTIVSSLLFNRVSEDRPRCGVGLTTVYVDTDGVCYVCDKLLGNQEFGAGSLRNGIRFRNNVKCTDLRTQCRVCDIRFVCGGRCLPQLLYYPDNKFQFYCDIQKAVVRKISGTLPKIEEMLKEGIVRQEDLDIEAHPIEKCTELIF